MKPWGEKRERRTKTPEQALAQLMRLAARAEKCEADARRLMRGWGVGTEDTERVLQRLVKERFISDSRYAEAFVREKFRLSGWGEFKIRQALQRKQIAREVIDEALEQVDRSKMGERLREKLRVKARTVKAATDYDRRTKLIRYGMSLGYDFETVQSAVAEQIKCEDPCEEF